MKSRFSFNLFSFYLLSHSRYTPPPDNYLKALWKAYRFKFIKSFLKVFNCNKILIQPLFRR